MARMYLYKIKLSPPVFYSGRQAFMERVKVRFLCFTARTQPGGESFLLCLVLHKYFFHLFTCASVLLYT